MWRKFKIKFLLTSLKSLTNSENPSSNPLQETCSGFQVVACYAKCCSESRLLLKKFPKAGYDLYSNRTLHGENYSMIAKESRNRNSDAAFGTVFRIRNCFQRSKERLKNIFLFHRAAWKYKNHLRKYKKYWVNLIGFKKYSSPKRLPMHIWYRKESCQLQLQGTQ